MKMRARMLLSVLIFSLFQYIEFSQPASAAVSYQNSGTYYAYESFTSSGTWSKPYGVSSIDYLVVAGGGRGGGSQASSHFAGGGGGGGGVRYGTLSVAQSSYIVTVGAGQAVGCSQGRGGTSSLAGTDITTVSATGGGSGSCNQNTGDGAGGLDGYSGGSGGGAGAQTYAKTYGAGNAGSYSPVEGYAGGTSYLHTTDASYQAGGGGGGAGQVGANATAACAGKGGNGYQSSITGVATYYGGGGGGGTRSNSCGGAAGSGGGGTGGLNGAQGTAGTNGLGGGGGGTSLSNGNKGGDGVVIIRYVVSAPDTPSLPAMSDTGRSNSDDITSATSFSLTGYAVGGASIQIYDGASAVGSPCTANISTGAYSCALTGITPGTHLYSAQASFGAGAAIASSSTLTVIVDTAAPTLSPAAAISLAENISSITTISCNETCTLSLSGGVDSATVNFDTSTGILTFKSAPDYEAPTDVGSDRTYAISITAVDVAGNTGTTNYVVTITNVNENSQLGNPAVPGAVYKGISINLTVSSNVAGKVRFFMDGKRIANCLAISTSGSYPNYTATCPWKPAVTSFHKVSASITPTDSTFSASNSDTTLIYIQKRSTSR